MLTSPLKRRTCESPSEGPLWLDKPPKRIGAKGTQCMVGQIYMLVPCIQEKLSQLAASAVPGPHPSNARQYACD